MGAEALQKVKPIKNQGYVLRTWAHLESSSPRYDVVIAVFDEKGAHRQWRSMVNGATRTAWEDDQYLPLPATKGWVGVLLEPFT